MDYTGSINEILDSSLYLLSNALPSEWAEANRFMTTDVSPFPGKFSFDRTPYLREPLDCLSPNHPAHTIAVMKGAQIGFSTGVIENGIGYIIAENPGNILFLTGHADLAEEAMSGKIDQMIDGCGLRDMIGPNVLRKKNQRTGDTNKSKEFPGGSLVAGSAGNHKLLRQRSCRVGFIDDFDAAKKSTKESGNTTKMIEQRFAAYADKKKLYYISTPEVRQNSNIEPVYLLGDQRKYHIPCPCCGEFIILHWSIEIDNQTYGIVYERDSEGYLVNGSVGYRCQGCGDVFTDADKHNLLIEGFFKPTAKPSSEGYYSYQISALYAPPGMYDWEHYVRQYIEANPINKPPDEKQMQTFTNLVLGECYEEKGKSPQANEIQKNIREYEVGSIPEKMSIDDGNGEIMLLTCACDLNGKIDDARLDYEIVAWSETGASYSIKHGSIGTFIPNQTQTQKDKDHRKKFTYMINEENNVWDLFDKVISTIYETDTGKRKKIVITGVDVGNTYGGNAYSYIERTPGFVIGVKGKDADKGRRFGIDTSTYRIASERSDLYLIEVNQVKDTLADLMDLKWSLKKDLDQPHGFMNFPIPSGGAYTFKDYFSHYEAEHRVVEKNKIGEGVSARWVKKGSKQNHLWDCRVYNMGLKDIVVGELGKSLKIKTFKWNDYVDMILGRV